MERFTFEQIEAMSADDMRQVLKSQELANQRADAAKAAAAKAEREKVEADQKFLDEYFEKRFEANLHPRHRGQY